MIAMSPREDEPAVMDEPMLVPCKHNEPYQLALKRAVYVRDLCQLIVEESYEGWVSKYGRTDGRQTHLRDMTLYALRFLQPFSVENAFKAVLQKAGTYSQKKHRIHSLHRLFKDVPDAIREEIVLVFYRRTGKGLHGTLKRHHNDFEKWRYVEDDAAEATDLDIDTFDTITDVCVDWLLADLPCSCSGPASVDRRAPGQA